MVSLQFKFRFFCLLFSAVVLLFPALPAFSQATETAMQADIVIIGGGTGGTAAAIQASRMGVKTILIEETNMLGGMLTAAGVSCTDGNDQFASGLWEEFRQRLYKHYGRNKLNTGWVSNTCFEPKVGDSILKAMAAAEKNLVIYYGYHVAGVLLNENLVKGVWAIHATNVPLTIRAAVVIDATETAYLLPFTGTLYDLGMDNPAVSGEKEAREKNNIIQDITWAAVLKDYGPGADKTIPQPANYDSTLYFCCNTNAPCNGKPWNGDAIKMLNYGKLPRSPGAKLDKYMLNWPANGNDFYANAVEAKAETRRQLYEKAKQQTLGFIYFLQTQIGLRNIGLADDELNGGMALIPYHREGRRLKGVTRLAIHHLKNPYDYNLYRTGIAVGDYPVDHHHAQYPGKVPEIEFPPIPAFNIPLGCLIPEKTDGLIVCEKGISVTNIANGSTRLQPVVLLTGQAAGVLAAMSVKQKKKIREVSVRAVQTELLKAKCYLMPFSDVKITDPAWEAVQRVGLTGILKGTGKPEGWANKMFFYPDSLIKGSELRTALVLFFKQNPGYLPHGEEQTIKEVFNKLKGIKSSWWKEGFNQIHKPEDLASYWKAWGLNNFNPDRFVTRRELAVWLDNYFLLFNKEQKIEHNGNFH
jgi:FAD dependent oxidoreductase